MFFILFYFLFIFYYDEIQMLCLLFNTTAPLNIYIFKFIKNIFTKIWRENDK